MGRILGIDVGAKRSGLSTTDPLQIIVSTLASVETGNLQTYLDQYINGEIVDKIVFGLPTHKDGTYTSIKPLIDTFVKHLSTKFPNIIIDFQDENFTSFEAKQIILESGKKKKDRRDKSLVDRVSAVIILQRYLKHI